MRQIRAVVLIAAGVALGVIAYRVQVHDAHSPGDRAAAIVLAGWAFLVAGLVCWARRPGNRLGPLMVATAFALLARQLRYSHDSGLFTVFFALGVLSYALIGHSALAYPFGHVRGRFERGLVAAGYAAALVFPLSELLFFDGRPPLLQYNSLDPAAYRSALLIWANDDVVDALQRTEIVVFFGVLATLLLVVIARNLIRASPRMRLVLLPLSSRQSRSRCALCSRVCSRSSTDRSPTTYVFWWQIAAVIALPVALLLGLLRARLARGNVGDLVLELERTPPSGLRDALARALDDPTLELAFWLPERREFVDAAGRPVELPTNDPRRAVTSIEHDGEPVAALVHDPSLLEEPELVRGRRRRGSPRARERASAGGAARAADERSRSRAPGSSRPATRSAVASSATCTTARSSGSSRSRSSSAAPQRRHRAAISTRGRAALRPAVDELQVAVEELRELARGIHPTILAEGGLAAALDTLASRSPLPVTVDGDDGALRAGRRGGRLLRRLRGARERRQARDTPRRRPSRRAARTGCSGRGRRRRRGRRAARRRHRACAGSPTASRRAAGACCVDSPPGGGTRVVGEIPCAS